MWTPPKTRDQRSAGSIDDAGSAKIAANGIDRIRWCLISSNDACSHSAAYEAVDLIESDEKHFRCKRTSTTSSYPS
ncbi:hypothetical protein WJX82_004371 [Trebouxia sp. C0006]